MIKKYLAIVFTLVFFSAAYAQNAITASAFFQSVSEQYGKIKDYEATMEITVGKQNMNGKVSFKRPDLLRIDFSNPENQVILFNGDELTIYLPGSSAVLQQSVTSSGVNLATSNGLTLMSRYYYIAYETGPNPVQLETGSDEYVISLILTRKNTTESFRSIVLSINPDTKMIRRVKAVTPQNQTFVFDFYDYVLNQNISDQRFIYDAPSSANNYNNFLFSE
ncbi:MAG: outer membrane lipoprotein carrier protein LolA [Treponema sp.]|nr:outer membrane lipoprotein carrier protein LolA [Treponema sp.]